MRNLSIIMPMCGIGQRFLKQGYDTPKPLILINNKPMFFKSINSFKNIKCKKEYIFIIRSDHNEKYNMKFMIEKYMNNLNYHIIILNHNTLGAADTVSNSFNIINKDNGIIIADCDLYIESYEYFNNIEKDLINKNNIAGYLTYFESNNPRYSYALCNNENKLMQIAQKKVISNKAIAGYYYFSNLEILKYAFNELKNNFNKQIDKEMYISYLYKYLLKYNNNIFAYKLDKYNSFGTPEELNNYLKSNKME